MSAGERDPRPAAGEAPPLPADERAAFARGVAQFNAGLYFECHDTLEELWSGLRGPDRDFVQGLIQLAVACYHLGNGNTAGAVSLFGRALGRLARYPDRHWGLDVAAQRAEIQARRARLEAGEAQPASPPRWDFAWLAGDRQGAGPDAAGPAPEEPRDP